MVFTDTADVQGSRVPNDRWAPVSKYRLAACLVCAFLLACVPAAALLRSPHRMQANVEAKTDLVGQAPPAAHMIHWASYPSKCLDVAGDKSGAQVQIFSCKSGQPNQQFILPPSNSTGEIKWATHPELCLDNPIGVALQMWKCSETSNEKRMFLVSSGENGHSRIHLAARPSKCVDIPDGVAVNGKKVQLWDCNEHEGNVAFDL